MVLKPRRNDLPPSHSVKKPTKALKILDKPIVKTIYVTLSSTKHENEP